MCVKEDSVWHMLWSVFPIRPECSSPTAPKAEPQTSNNDYGTSLGIQSHPREDRPTCSVLDDTVPLPGADASGDTQSKTCRSRGYVNNLEMGVHYYLHRPLGVKSYPRGVTTNSESGIESYTAYYDVFKAMEEEGMVLNLHGEVPSDPRTVGPICSEYPFLLQP